MLLQYDQNERVGVAGSIASAGAGANDAAAVEAPTTLPALPDDTEPQQQAAGDQEDYL